jgi:toxin ParE1/3/4
MPRLKLRATPEARADIRQALKISLKHWGSAQRDIYRTELDNAMFRIMDAPLIGLDRSDLAGGLRSLPVKSHILFYRVENQTVVVYRVLHQHMDFDVFKD